MGEVYGRRVVPDTPSAGANSARRTCVLRKVRWTGLVPRLRNPVG